MLPERRATRSYWLVTHEDTRSLGRIRAVVRALESERDARPRNVRVSPFPLRGRLRPRLDVDRQAAVAPCPGANAKRPASLVPHAWHAPEASSP